MSMYPKKYTKTKKEIEKIKEVKMTIIKEIKDKLDKEKKNEIVKLKKGVAT